MDYVLRDNIRAMLCELRNGSLTVKNGDFHGAKVVCNGVEANDMRIFVHDGVLHVKNLSADVAQVELYLSSNVVDMHINGENMSCNLSDLSADTLTVSTTGSCTLDNVNVRCSMSLRADKGRTILRSCDLQSATINAVDADIDFQGTTLHGYNLIYLVRCRIGGVLKGMLPDYIFAAGNGVEDTSVIINEHLLNEFPTRKITHHSAWIYISGSVKGMCRIYVKQPYERRL